MGPTSSKSLTAILCRVVLDSRFQFRPEMPNQTLQRPCEGFSEGTNGVTLNLLGNLLEHVDFAGTSLPLFEAFHNLHSP